MKNKNMKTKQISAKKGGGNKMRFSADKDPFFMERGSKRSRREEDEEDIESEEEEEDDFGYEAFGSRKENEEEEVEETAAEKKKRLAEEYLKKKRLLAKKEEEEEIDDDDDDDRVEKEGLRDSLVAKILQQEQLEESGRVRRGIASRYILVIYYQFWRECSFWEFLRNYLRT